MRSYLLNKFTVTERQIASRIATNIDLTSKYAMENSLVLEQVDETSTYNRGTSTSTSSAYVNSYNKTQPLPKVNHIIRHFVDKSKFLL
jgi:hypothetical protein